MLGHLKRQRKAEENNKDTGRETDIKSVETDRQTDLKRKHCVRVRNILQGFNESMA